MKIISRLFSFVLLVVLFAAGFCVYLLYDGNNLISQDYYDNTLQIDEEANKVLVNSLSNTSSTGIIDFTFTDEQLNRFISSAILEANKALQSSSIYISGVEFKLSDNHNIDVYAHMKFSFFPMSVSSVLLINEDIDEISVQVEKFKLSKLDLYNGTIKSIWQNSLNDSNVQSQLNNLGVEIISNSDKLIIKMEYKKLLKKALSSIDEAEGDLYISLINLAIDNNIVDLCFNESSKLGLKINLEPLKYSESLNGVLLSNEAKINEVKAKMEKLIVENIVDYKTSSKVLFYLFNGYNQIKDDEDYEFLSSLDLNCVGISDYKEYSGIKSTTVDFLSIIEEQAKGYDFSNFGELNFKLSEDNLNDILMSVDADVLNYCLYYNDTSYKFSYIYLEGIYSIIGEDEMSLNCVLNINGYRIALKVDMIETSSTGLKVTSRITNVYAGTILVDDATKNNILKFIDVALKEEKWISLDSNAEELHISLDGYFEKSTFYKLISGIINSNTSFDKIDSKGYVNVTMNLK